MRITVADEDEVPVSPSSIAAGEPREEVPLSGGHLSRVVRIDETVRRPCSFWSPAVHRLLVELRRAGFSGAPEFLGTDELGREVLSWVDGEAASGAPLPGYVWTDSALERVGGLLRELHDASALFVRELVDLKWQQIPLARAAAEVMCHNDCAPWNTVFRDGVPVAFIDWDLAAPGTRLWDVAYAAWHWVPLWVDQRALDHGFEELADRPRRLRLLCDAYGLADRSDLLSVVERRQLAWARTVRQGAAAGVEAYVRLEAAGAANLEDLAWLRVHKEVFTAALTA